MTFYKKLSINGTSTYIPPYVTQQPFIIKPVVLLNMCNNKGINPYIWTDAPDKIFSPKQNLSSRLRHQFH